MKVKFENPVFHPITITLENKEEMETFLLGSNLVRDQQIGSNVYDLFTSINRAIGLGRGDQ